MHGQSGPGRGQRAILPIKVIGILNSISNPEKHLLLFNAHISRANRVGLFNKTKIVKLHLYYFLVVAIMKIETGSSGYFKEVLVPTYR
jgi:hypothetical protein